MFDNTDFREFLHRRTTIGTTAAAATVDKESPASDLSSAATYERRHRIFSWLGAGPPHRHLKVRSRWF
uniref:Uncharacterized protein n=1 Tax=Arundo donax TaxID=35708 RepID=A0A0A9AUJ6_ARUDO